VLLRGEIEAPISRKLGLSAVGFLDAGAIVDPNGTSVGRSVGAGLIWRSPIGPLRLDHAVPLDGAGPPRFLFSIGGGW
jgi:outer membrane translocation and assembly module TamA